MQVSEHTLIFAFRYALGRMSTAPSIVVDDLQRNWNQLSDFTKKQIKEEILEAIKLKRAGMDCDIAEWQKILEMEN